jgi:tetratricopeptide (TPR) repeat protein
MFPIKLLTRNLVIILFSFSGLVVFNRDSAIAQTEVIEPLAIPQNDPLLPPSNLERELSPLEEKRIRAEIAALEIEANNRLAQGQPEEAFELWFRQLRLYRAIDPLAEITALGRVGEIAWQANRKEELKVITNRLNELYPEEETENNFTTEFLSALGTSYQQVRNLDSAIAIYLTLLDRSRQANENQLKIKYLETLGELYLDKFDYPQAAIIYEKLLALSDEELAEVSPENYLSQLIKIYDYTKEPEQGIKVKEQLLDYYTAQENTEPIVDILIALGDDYQSLDRVELAIQAYQEAVIFGQLLQQLASISESLTKLANLYQEQKQYSLAIQTYNKLLDVEIRAYNSYGVMNSYDRLGQIYLLIEDYDRALSVFTEGLKIAQSLDVRVSYFTELIDRVKVKN